MRATRFLLAASALGAAGSATAETTIYKYDARGRLVETSRSGGPNDGAVTTYGLDKADNRLTKTVTGGLGTVSPPADAASAARYRIIPIAPITPGSPPAGVIVVPAGG